MTGMSAERIDHWLIVDETRFITAIGAFVIWRAQLNAESFSGNSERNGATHWTKTNCETPTEIASASMDSTNAWADTARSAPPTRKMPAMAHPRRRGPCARAQRDTAGRSSISSTSPSRGGTRRSATR